MKRITPHILNALAAISLLLCLATLVLWIRSYFVRDVLFRFVGSDGVPRIVLSARGQFARAVLLTSPGRGWLSSLQEGRPIRYVHIFTLAAVLPLVRLITWPARREARLLAAGVCLQCGYDLRATPNRCPECGTIPSNATP